MRHRLNNARATTLDEAFCESKMGPLASHWYNRLLACCHRQNKCQRQSDKSPKRELPDLFGVSDNARFFNLKVLFRVFLIIVVFYFVLLLIYFALAELGFESLRPTNIFFIRLGYIPFFVPIFQGCQYRASFRNKSDNQQPLKLKRPRECKGTKYCCDNKSSGVFGS